MRVNSEWALNEIEESHLQKKSIPNKEYEHREEL
jgi:hypothetical protein